MTEVSTLRNKKQALWILGGLIITAALWALNIELTYERNVRRGIPADFRLHRSNATHIWRA
jgi:hypothetical protein